MTEEFVHVGNRRAGCWWEPIYDPAIHLPLSVSHWDFADNTGPRNAFLSPQFLSGLKETGVAYKLLNLTFETCDFQGEFSHKPTLIFEKCRFFNCDFAYSTWHYTTFRECVFDSCSIALATFKECEFRDCQWQKIGFSGHKTVIQQTFITGPSKLIEAGFSGINPFEKDDKQHRAKQKYRLEGTKAHLARNILYSHQVVGDDSTYYESAKLHDVQQAKSHIFESLFGLRFGQGWKKKLRSLDFIYWWIELQFLQLIGYTNGWGSRLSLPFIMLLANFVFFALVYQNCFSVDQNWQKSFDITTLAGYAIQTAPAQQAPLRICEGIQLAFSILLYSIFFSTAVARFSRTR